MNSSSESSLNNLQNGIITRISGPVVGVSGLPNLRLFDVVKVGHLGLVGEVIRLSEDQATVQVYENTDGIQVGEPVFDTALPLVAKLGPGLLGSIYDGLQRPLEILAEKSGYFIQRGLNASPLSEERFWNFSPCVHNGDLVHPGDILGEVPESKSINHRILLPQGKGGRVVKAFSGDFKINDIVVVIEPENNKHRSLIEIPLYQIWPVRRPRPIHARLPAREPLMTGTRIIDFLFPVAKGGAAIIPGGFGTGKTVAEHSLARWSDIDVVVYVGCGERGNEMTQVLEEFPNLEDPRTNAPLIQRTVLIANTSNMPVAAREASIYTGITIAEYYRDMGYDVLLLADSTSRWGEALREISGRLEEMPGEEGYPAYLAARLSEFYERSGRVVCKGSGEGDGKRRSGSITVVGAVSPPGGDFSEPITQNSMRVAGTFWALDYDLSRRRHFPSINWTNSFSLYELSDWYISNIAADWSSLISETRALLQREVELLEIVRLVGPDALADIERVVLAIARMLREDFLQQSAYDSIDRYCPSAKAYWMMKAIIDFYQRTREKVESGISLEKIMAYPVVAEIARMKEYPIGSAVDLLHSLMDRIQTSFEEIEDLSSV